VLGDTDADLVLGQPDFTSAEEWPYGPHTGEKFRFPYAVCLDGDTLAVADTATQQAVLPGAEFTERTLAEVRRRGWAQSAAEREPGVASVSAPVRDRAGAVVAAVSVSGPIDRMGRHPGERWAADLLAAAAELTSRL
jgi:hypothetical protein